MAKILPGPVVAEARGQMGGVVFSRNRYGLYIRNNSSPVNPNSSRQVAIRALFTQMSQHWRDTLTAAQRAAWELYAAGTPLRDQFGLPQLITGANMYCRFNVPWVDIGETRVDNAPPAGGQAAMLSTTLTGTTGAGVQLTAYSPTLAANDRIYVKCSTAAMSQAREFFNGPWERRAYLAGDVALPTLLIAAGSMVIGQRWFFRFRALLEDGTAGPEAQDSVDILA